MSTPRAKRKSYLCRGRKKTDGKVTRSGYRGVVARLLCFSFRNVSNFSSHDDYRPPGICKDGFLLRVLLQFLGFLYIILYSCPSLEKKNERAAELGFTFKPLTTNGRKGIANQVLVTFSTVGDRDKVKALAVNLASDREAGLQLEPPDHLRSHYLTFQSLAYNLKTRNPSLKRNIKFCDSDMSLEMDYTIGDGWRTIGYEDEDPEVCEEQELQKDKAGTGYPPYRRTFSQRDLPL